jgi:hypothetical protein
MIVQFEATVRVSDMQSQGRKCRKMRR